MRSLILAALGVGLLAAGGCNSPQWPLERRATMNSWMVNDYHDEAIRNGVIADHTLYPHHFVAYGSRLNELGRRDLDILAQHYRANPGQLNVRRNGADGALYAARIEHVRAMLGDQGVDMARVEVADGPAGGEGVMSERVLIILEEKFDKPLQADPTSGTEVSSSQRS
jgi:hypothetical protein